MLSDCETCWLKPKVKELQKDLENQKKITDNYIEIHKKAISVNHEYYRKLEKIHAYAEDQNNNGAYCQPERILDIINCSTPKTTGDFTK